MMPLLILGQRCLDCERRWLAITTLPQPDKVCWYCGSSNVEVVGRPKRWRAPATDPPEDESSS